VLTVAVVRHLLGRPSERGFLAEVRRDGAAYFPALPAQSEFNRRVRWLWGAFEGLRQRAAAAAPEDPWQQVDTSALPVKHPSRVRGPDAWGGPGDLVAGFGFDAAHREWCYGFRLAVRTDLGSRVVRAWGLVPAAVDERAVADGRRAGPPPAGLVLDRGFLGAVWAAAHRARGTRGVHTPGRSAAAAAARPTPHRGAAQSHRDHHRRADRAAGSGAPRGQDALGPAHPRRRHHARPHPAATERAVIAKPTSDA